MMTTIENILKRSEVFLGLEDSDLRQIASMPSSQIKTFQSGETIFSLGDDAKYLYILKEGEVDLMITVTPERSSEPVDLVIEKVTTGGLFGWSAMVGPYIYVLTAICQKPCQAVIIAGDELIALFDRDSRVGYRVFRGLSRVIGSRLRDIEQALASGQRWPLVGGLKTAGDAQDQ